jgi:hypothetical protein
LKDEKSVQQQLDKHTKICRISNSAIFSILVKNIMPNLQTGERFFALPESREKTLFFSRNFYPVLISQEDRTKSSECGMLGLSSGFFC